MGTNSCLVALFNSSYGSLVLSDVLFAGAPFLSESPMGQC